jgi:hypothetical protein
MRKQPVVLGCGNLDLIARPYVDLSAAFIDRDHIRFLFASQELPFPILCARVEHGPKIPWLVSKALAAPETQPVVFGLLACLGV